MRRLICRTCEQNGRHSGSSAKVYVTAIYELLCVLDGLLIVGTFNELRRLCDVAV